MADAFPCATCGTEVAPGLLACPVCHRLVHGDRLRELAATADAALRAGDSTASLVAWRDALELLPPGSKQHQAIADRIATIGQGVDLSSLPPPPPRPTPGAPATATEAASGPTGGRAGLAGVGTILILLVAKGKFLLLGLTKASTFFPMLASVGVFWTEIGWPIAIGIVVSIYIHEMGHVYVLSRYGIKASAPLFIPGLGAVIRLRQVLTDPRQDARAGLAGPVWGLAAALGFAAAGFALEQPAMLATARLGAFINLFNLLPVWSLDGGRAFRSLSRPQRWFAATALALAWALTEHWLLMVLTAVAAIRALTDRGASLPDRPALATYVALVGALSALAMLPIPH